LHSNDSLDLENSNFLFDYFKFLHFFRHNFFHYLVLQSLGQIWEEEKQLKDIFPIQLPENYERKSPDIVFLKKEEIYLIDVSVSYDIHKSEKMKSEKYQPIADWLSENYLKTYYYHINLKNDYSNIEQELYKLNKIMIEDFDYLSFYRMDEIINDKKEWVNDHIDKEEFERLKNDEYNKNKNREKMENKQILFLDELRYETIGKYSDLEIETKLFKDYNEEFDLLKKC